MKSFLVELISTVAPMIIILVIVAIPILIDSAKNNWRKRFREQVKLGIINSNLSYPDMLHIAERWSQDRKAILFSLRILHSDAISGDDEKLSDSLDLIRRLIEEHQTNEPFAELPESIGLQLSNIKKELGSNENSQIAQLAASLSTIYSSSLQDLSKQKKLTFWGFIFGALGLVVGIGSLYSTFSGV